MGFGVFIVIWCMAGPVGNLTGILNDNELHLTEVKGVLSVRPNLTYLDKSDRRAKQEGKTFAAHFNAVPVFVFLI